MVVLVVGGGEGEGRVVVVVAVVVEAVALVAAVVHKLEIYNIALKTLSDQNFFVAFSSVTAIASKGKRHTKRRTDFHASTIRKYLYRL